MSEVKEINGVVYTEIQHRRYKYSLAQPYEQQTDITGMNAYDEFLSLSDGGLLTLQQGYAWDGPSGPAPDIACMMRGSLVHDGFYQLMRNRLVDQSWRKRADQVFREMCIADGLPEAAAQMAYWALRKFGAKAARPKKQRRSRRKRRR